MPATISLLPAECLSEILSYVKADEVDVTDPTTFPVNLYLVCKAWRAIVLSTAEIWSRIRVDLERYNSVPAVTYPDEFLPPPDNRLMYSTILSTLQILLKRSKLQPLTICIHARSLLPSSQTNSSTSEHLGQRWKDLLGSILVVLLRNSNRWLDVEFDFDPNLITFIIPPGRNYPLLKRLSIGGEANTLDTTSTVASESVLNSLFPIRGTFSSTPRLTRLALYKVPACIQRLSLPWCQITHLELSLYDIFTRGYRFIITVIGRLVSLKLRQLRSESLSIMGPPFLFFTPAAESLTECAQLEELSLVCPQGIPQTAAALFSNLRVPQLKVLHIQLSLSLRPSNSEEWIPSFRACLFHSDCPIRSLTLKDMDGAAAYALLDAIPTVEELVLEAIRFTKPLLNGLTYRTRSRKRSVPFSPSKLRRVGRKVTRLAVHKPRFIDDAEGPKDFVTMVLSRLPDKLASVKTPANEHDDTCAQTAMMQGIPLTTLRVTDIPVRCAETPSFTEPSFTLYQLLAQQAPRLEKAGLRFEFDKGTV